MTRLTRAPGPGCQEGGGGAPPTTPGWSVSAQESATESTSTGLRRLRKGSSSETQRASVAADNTEKGPTIDSA